MHTAQPTGVACLPANPMRNPRNSPARSIATPKWSEEDSFSEPVAATQNTAQRGWGGSIVYTRSTTIQATTPVGRPTVRQMHHHQLSGERAGNARLVRIRYQAVQMFNGRHRSKNGRSLCCTVTTARTRTHAHGLSGSKRYPPAQPISRLHRTWVLPELEKLNGFCSTSLVADHPYAGVR